MRADFFDYDLPPGLIAQEPCSERDKSRLLVVRRPTQSIEHRIFEDLPELLNPGDLLVLNDTRVVPARLVGRRARTGGRLQRGPTQAAATAAVATRRTVRLGWGDRQRTGDHGRATEAIHVRGRGTAEKDPTSGPGGPGGRGSLGSEQDHARPTPISGIVLYTLRSSGFERAGAMATGTVEWFEAERGYRSSPTTTVNDGGKNVFVRQSEIRVEGPRAGAGSSRSPRAERACEPTRYDSSDRSSVSPARFSTPPGAGLGIRPARASGPEGRRGL